jgi:hypothetical protein
MVARGVRFLSGAADALGFNSLYTGPAAHVKVMPPDHRVESVKVVLFTTARHKPTHTAYARFLQGVSVLCGR